MENIMTAVKTIFVKDLVSLAGSVSIALTSNGAKTPKYTAEVTSGTDVLDVYGTDGKIKVFADAGAASKFVGKYMDVGNTITVVMPSDAIAPKPVASSDPTKEIAKKEASLNKDISAAQLNLTKYNALVASAIALGWATGNSAEQAKLAEDQAVVTLLTGYIASLNTALSALTGGTP
jgi:hypothetical protein